MNPSSKLTACLLVTLTVAAMASGQEDIDLQLLLDDAVVLSKDPGDDRVIRVGKQTVRFVNGRPVVGEKPREAPDNEENR